MKKKCNKKVVPLLVSIALFVVFTITLIFICTGGYTCGCYTATSTTDNTSYTATYKLNCNKTGVKTTISTVGDSRTETKTNFDWKIEEDVLYIKAEKSAIYVVVGEINEFKLNTILSSEDFVLENKAATGVMIASIVIMSLSFIGAIASGVYLSKSKKKKK